jgi:uncharacterized iron-regulated protein
MLSKVHFVHVSLGARVVARHSAAQPEGPETSLSNSRTFPHLSLAVVFWVATPSRPPQLLCQARHALPVTKYRLGADVRMRDPNDRAASDDLACCGGHGRCLALGACHGRICADAQGRVEDLADIAEAAYADARDTARTLKLAVDAMLAQPTEVNLRAARAAWIAARIPYSQTEAYRFGNAIVDDWEGRVNSWPLDEGLIDYVAPSYGTDSAANALYTANVIANPVLTIGGKTIDATNITKELLAN